MTQHARPDQTRLRGGGRRSVGQERDVRKGVQTLACLLAAIAVASVAMVWLLGPPTRAPLRRDARVESQPVTQPLTFPVSVTVAPRNMRELYEFADRRPDVLHYVPCFCGCWRLGHKSSGECFIRNVRPDGAVAIDAMGFT